jgi:deazaflavin-dependent oxidoreductase (nitroreductase family)
MSPFFKLFVTLHSRLYRATSGKVGGGMGGGKVLLLTTTGNKSGQPRTVPVMYFDLGGKTYVVASAGGSPEHPAWYKNLAAKPDVTVEIGPRRFAARAATVGGDERARVWASVTGTMPRFIEYEKKTQGREIPVVRLDESAPS